MADYQKSIIIINAILVKKGSGKIKLQSVEGFFQKKTVEKLLKL